jgi:XTP/dITP diphosphohydrolase
MTETSQMADNRITLYAATSNTGKLTEFATAAQPSGISVEPLPNLASLPEPLEDADTFQGNADLKAIAYSLTLPNELVFADDSGLSLPALNGSPGVRSARYADDLNFSPGSGTKDDRNNRALLSNLQFHTDRSAQFLCTLALARDGQILLRATGHVQGEILSAPRGGQGFGYDPLFLLPELHLTMAELPRERKWQLSHRGQAFRSLLAQLAR